MRAKVLAAGLVLTLLATACERRSGGELSSGVEAPASSAPRLIDRARELGLEFVHHDGSRGERRMPETLGGGGGWIDHDADGWLDVYLVNGNDDPVHGKPAADGPRNVLFRYDPQTRRFHDVTERAGVGDRGYGQGLAVGDFDNDGLDDLYVTNLGRDVLYHNRGDGRFEDVTAAAGIRVEGWSTSATFLDYDLDGHLDLYVCRYVDVDPSVTCRSPDGQPTYCGPTVFPGLPDRLLRNRGDGTFEDVSEAAGVSVAGRHEGKSLGVVAGDLDLDGDPDLYVACDQVPNLYFENRGDGTFRERGLLANLAYSARGESQAGMGVDAGDFDLDGRPDLVVTNFAREPMALYRNLGTMFEEVSARTGLAAVSLTPLGFGVCFFDHDLDGDLDLYVGNGHVQDRVAELHPGLSFRQPDQLIDNRDGERYEDISARAGDWFRQLTLTRAVAPADFDGDGDEDLLVVQGGGAVALLENRTPDRGHHLVLRLEGSRSVRDAQGARVELRARSGERELRLVRECRGGGSYLAARDRRVRFGLGRGEITDLAITIRWPSGRVQELEGLEIDREHRIREPRE